MYNDVEYILCNICHLYILFSEVFFEAFPPYF